MNTSAHFDGRYEYSMPAMIGIVGVLLVIISNSMSSAFGANSLLQNWRIRIRMLGVLEPMELTG